jgi:hypothetical protein
MRPRAILGNGVRLESPTRVSCKSETVVESGNPEVIFSDSVRLECLIRVLFQSKIALKNEKEYIIEIQHIFL